METNDASPLSPSDAADASVSPYDRLQMRPASGEKGKPGWRALALMALVVAGLVLAYSLFFEEEGFASDNFLVHLIESSASFTPDLGTTRQEDAEEYVYGQLGWGVTPPDLPGLALVGVQIAVVGEIEGGTTSGTPVEVVVPAYRYESETGESAIVYAYDYIVLDRVRSAFDLPEATYAVLSEPTPVDTRRHGDAYLVTWRRRAMIFTAITASEGAFERIQQAVSS